MSIPTFPISAATTTIRTARQGLQQPELLLLLPRMPLGTAPVQSFRSPGGTAISVAAAMRRITVSLLRALLPLAFSLPELRLSVALSTTTPAVLPLALLTALFFFFCVALRLLLIGRRYFLPPAATRALYYSHFSSEVEMFCTHVCTHADVSARSKSLPWIRFLLPRDPRLSSRVSSHRSAAGGLYKFLRGPDTASCPESPEDYEGEKMKRPCYASHQLKYFSVSCCRRPCA